MYFQVDLDIFNHVKVTYTDHLRKFINANDVDGVKFVLNKIQVPEELLTYGRLSDTTTDIVVALFDSKLATDKFVKCVLELML